jgi:membrane protein implicated in regulation of membrane protease activity
MIAVYVWAGAGVLLMIFEMLAPGFVLLWLGIGCLSAAAAVALHAGTAIQVLVFCVVSFVLVVTAQTLFRHTFRKVLRPQATVTNVEALIGQRVVVVEAIDNARKVGTVKIGGEVWSARSVNDEPISPETGVVRRRVEGAKVFVEVA